MGKPWARWHDRHKDIGILILLALAKLILHTLTNGNYGFHRDELATIDDGRYPGWGYVAYPPVTPWIAHVALALFGASLAGLRFFAALAQSIVMVLAGLFFCFRRPAGRTYRMLGWMAVVPVVLFLIAQGRGYYTGPVYAILLAAGAVWWQERLAPVTPARRRLLLGINWGLLAIGGALILPLGPYARINSPVWNVASEINTDLKEEVGWPELVQTVAGIYNSLPAADRPRAGILAGNYGEAGAVDLYGPSYGLPRAISGINSYWLRGYGDPPPETLIVIGLSRDSAERLLAGCTLAGHVTNAYGVKNEETTRHPDIWLCKGPRKPWPEFWRGFRYFG
jgi:hypothetical protein